MALFSHLVLRDQCKDNHLLEILIQNFITSVLRYPTRWAGVGIGLMALCASFGLRLKIADDARALIADGDSGISKQLEALSEFTAVDNLLIHLDSQGHPDELENALQTTVEALVRSDRFTSIQHEIGGSAQLELLDKLLPRRWILDKRSADSLFSPAELEKNLATLRETILAPQGFLQKSYLMRDPLGSMGAALSNFSSIPGLPRLTTDTGRFLSADRNSLLIIAAPKGAPFSSHDAKATMAVIDSIPSALRTVSPHVVVRSLGAHRFTRDAEKIISHDVHFSVITSLIGVLLIFVTFFRRPILIFAALPPLLFGAAVALGAAGLMGTPIHAIVLAFAAACVSLSIDSTIHLVSTVAACGHDTRLALPVAAQRIGPSLSMVMTTTVAGLLALMFSQVGAMRQMGFLSAIAVVAAFVGTLLWVPIVLPLLTRHTAAPPLVHGPWTWAVEFSTRHPKVIVAGAAVVAVVFGTLALNARIDGDLRNLDTHTSFAQADEAAFIASFGDPGSSALALVEGPDLQNVLESAQRVADVLHEEGALRVLSITTFVPPQSLARQRLQTWCENQHEKHGAFQNAAQRVGFRANAFSDFETEWQRVCANSDELMEPSAVLSALESQLQRSFVRKNNAGYRLAIAFDVSNETFPKIRDTLARTKNVTFVHRATLNSRLVNVVAEDLPKLALIAFALVVALLFASFRDWIHPLRALAPAILALFFTFGVMSAFGIAINLMNLCVLPLLAGIGIDYGVLLSDADRDPDPNALKERAFSLSVAALTTVSDFGTMALADYYAMATIGQTVILAVGSAALFALFLSPALAALSKKDRPA